LPPTATLKRQVAKSFVTFWDHLLEMQQANTRVGEYREAR